MEQKLYAFWKYDTFPYCLGGLVEKFKGDLVYIKSYQAHFRPFKVLEAEEGLKLHEKLKTLEALRDHQIHMLNCKFDKELKDIIQIPTN